MFQKDLSEYGNNKEVDDIVLCLVAQSCPTHCDPMDCSPLGSSVLGILQARILEWVATPWRPSSSSLNTLLWGLAVPIHHCQSASVSEGTHDLLTELQSFTLPSLNSLSILPWLLCFLVSTLEPSPGLPLVTLSARGNWSIPAWNGEDGALLTFQNGFLHSQLEDAGLVRGTSFFLPWAFEM